MQDPTLQSDATMDEAPAARSVARKRRRGRSLLRMGLEVLLIAAGVFLGLAGEQWRERTARLEAAEASLRRFRTEIVTNRDAVARVRDYHDTVLKRMRSYLAADAGKRPEGGLPMEGLQPVSFDQTAWDLALATESLAYLDQDLAFGLARIYSRQKMYADLTSGIVNAMYLRPPGDDLDAFLRSVSVYYGDIVLIEPALLRMYDELLPRIDRALGDPPSPRSSSR